MHATTTNLLRQLKTLGDPTRLRLVSLCRHGECSVSELTRVIGQSQPRISQHLKQLCDAGFLERFRDGKRVFYRVGDAGQRGPHLDALLALIPDADPAIQDDTARLLRGRGQRVGEIEPDAHHEIEYRALHRAILDLTVTAPIGDLLDVGCGRGALLKLLAGRANRAVGVDIDASARQLARAELLLAGIPNCSLRQGDMYRLPFDDASFNTIIIDDVLSGARRPVRALEEARRLLKPGGRLFIVESLERATTGKRRSARDAAKSGEKDLQTSLAEWSKAAALRLAPGRLVPTKNPAWLVSVATNADRQDAVA